MQIEPSTIETTTTVSSSNIEATSDVRDLLASDEDMDGIRYKLQLEKARLAREKSRYSDTYKTLAVLEKVKEHYM